eukprot:TRINITY_DN27758_c0_g1_i1.p1 TRINITY_DN27758_c0_g1~~TRINITY_DN27758_c0_g1_i1.p1  ORF type:complete len:285 (+),score=63.30 TRINITY_DN27758_c0_g1_i1:86-940(+)
MAKDGVMLTGVDLEKKNRASEDDDLPPGPVPDMAAASIQERSAHLYADPKMMELKHYVNSHRHEERLRAAAELEARHPGGGESPKASPSKANTPKSALGRKDLRTEGCAAMDRHAKRLASEKVVLPHIGPCCTSVPDGLLKSASATGIETDQSLQKTLDARSAMLSRMDRFQTRLQWRAGMDFSLRRLLVDLELARDDRLKEYANQARCEHLDKIYTWYLANGMKEARKEKIAPPYIRYRGDGPVMAGSMRPTPSRLRHAQGPSMARSASAPSLPPAGDEPPPP